MFGDVTDLIPGILGGHKHTEMSHRLSWTPAPPFPLRSTAPESEVLGENVQIFMKRWPSHWGSLLVLFVLPAQLVQRVPNFLPDGSVSRDQCVCVENRLSVEQSPKASTQTRGRTKSCNTSRAFTSSPAVMRDRALCYGHALKSLDVCFSLSLRVMLFCLTRLV